MRTAQSDNRESKYLVTFKEDGGGEGGRERVEEKNGLKIR